MLSTEILTSIMIYVTIAFFGIFIGLIVVSEFGDKLLRLKRRLSFPFYFYKSQFVCLIGIWRLHIRVLRSNSKHYSRMLNWPRFKFWWF